jgi:murein DD-endopeptidase MepM/ murein hydrolase activator NlpD
MTAATPNGPDWDVDPFEVPAPTATKPRPQGQAKPKAAPQGKQPEGFRRIERQLNGIERRLDPKRLMKQTTWAEVGILWGLYLVTIAIPPTMATANHVAYQWEQVSQSRAAQWMGLAGEKQGDRAADGQSYASPIVGKTLQDLVNYKPSQGQSFGPETGNKRSYGPHGGVDFDCRVGGCAGAAVASPMGGRVSEIRRIGSSANGGSYQVHIVSQDWAGEVEHQLVHVDSIMVAVGDTVTAGQVVAKVSPTDSVSTGPHLDWKIKRGGQWVNPQTWAKEAMAAPTSAGGDFPIDQYVQAIAAKESGSSYSAVNPHSGALGKYQFMPATMASTAKSCLGRVPMTAEFLGTPDLQDKIMHCYTASALPTIQAKSDDLKTQCRMLASFHYSGNPDKWDNKRRQTYNGASYPSIADYTTDICKGF